MVKNIFKSPELKFQQDTIGGKMELPFELLEQLNKNHIPRHKLRAKSPTKKYVKRDDRKKKRRSTRIARRKNRGAYSGK